MNNICGPLSFFGSKSAPFQWAYLAVRMGLSLVFIWSGMVKILDPQSFAITIQAYGLIPEITALPVALLLSLLEVAAGVGLLFDVQGSLETITGLLILFMLILGYGIRLGLDVDCGCFGPDDPEAKAFHDLRPALRRDFVMILGIGFLFFWRRRRKIRTRKFIKLYQLMTKGGKQV